MYYTVRLFVNQVYIHGRQQELGLYNVNLVYMIKTNNTSTLYQFYCAHFNKLLFIQSEAFNYLVRLSVFNMITAYCGVL